MPDQLNGTVPQGTFGVSKDDQDPSGPAAYPITTPMGVVSPPNINVSGGGSSGGKTDNTGSMIGGTIGKIGGSIIGGPIGGAIGGVLGDVFGGLFAEGGPVTHGNPVNEFAEGGEVKQNPPQDALTMGYLIGAHHQKNYGGTPKTLTQAANDIKQILMGSPDDTFMEYDSKDRQNSRVPGEGTHQIREDRSQPPPDQPIKGQERGFASGGSTTPSASTSTTQAADPTATTSTPQKSFNSYDDLAQYYGENTGDTSSVGGDSSSQSAPQSQQSSMPTSTPTTNTLTPSASSSSTTTAPDPVSISPNTVKGSYKYASQGGYMNYADGGPGEQPQQPLQAGQQFQGDGSVKGPGGPQDDAIPAKLSNGEFVMSAPATQFFGVDKLNQMNEKGKQGFMQMTQQVQDNQNPQGQSPGAEAQMAPPGNGMMQRPQMPPQGAMKDGGSVLRSKGSGYMGL